MAVQEILKEAIEKRRCVTMLVDGWWRQAAPLALGVKAGRAKVLAFQYHGESKSGLAPGGAWRCFFLDDIGWAQIVDDPWRSGHYPIAKIEASFDYVICGLGARPRIYEHLKPG